MQSLYVPALRKPAILNFFFKNELLLPAYRVVQELQFAGILFVPKATSPQVISLSVGFVLSTRNG